MRLLSKDLNKLMREFPSAWAFINAGMLREEAHTLACIKSKNDWEERRLIHLLKNAPACQEEWFQDLEPIQDFIFVQFVIEEQSKA